MPSQKQDATPPHVKTYITEVCGKKGLKVAQIIGEGATDEKIEKKTNLKMAEIRAILNQLHEHGIVEYVREKNLNNGWFTYTWRVNPDRALQNFVAVKKREYEALKQRAATEEAVMFYKCRNNCARVKFEDAMENEFRCPQCKGKMKYAPNDEVVKELEEKISVLEKMLGKAQA